MSLLGLVVTASDEGVNPVLSLADDLVDLANGEYQIIIKIGDLDWMHDQIDIYSEDILEVDNLDAPAGSFQEVSFLTTVTDGQLNLRFQDDGGSDPGTQSRLAVSGPEQGPCDTCLARDRLGTGVGTATQPTADSTGPVGGVARIGRSGTTVEQTAQCAGPDCEDGGG